jgi:L-ascorbate metabolism protein UlaG (beta-lactamase superfamily)
VRLTHIGGPTVLIELDGWRLLTDPTFDPPGRDYRCGWGTGSRKLAGPAIAAADVSPIDAVLLTHEHHVALLHLGGVRFPVTAPVHYTLTAREAVELCGLIRPRVAIPVHYEGWKHFKQGREEIEREFAGAPEELRRSVRWLPIGEAVDV